MKNNNYINVLIIVIIFISFSCSNNQSNEAENYVEDDSRIQITVGQFESDQMKLGELSIQPFEELVACNGIINAPIDGIAHISARISGIVESINYNIGEHVLAGEKLCTISSSTLIAIQQDFLETSANLERLKIDFERSKALYNENIGAKKDYVSKESMYKAMSAKYQSLKMQLKQLNLSIEKIDKGDLYTTFSILAPISGYITNMNMVMGSYIEPQIQTMEIIDTDKLQLQLSVFEDDISNVLPGQKVNFKLLGESIYNHHGVLQSIGKTINTNSKTVHCTAKIIGDENYNFTNGSYVEANIIVKSSKSLALPSEAVVKHGDNYYILVVDQFIEDTYYLRKEKIEIGNVCSGYTEIIHSGPVNNIVIQGIYNLQMD
ncbi:MAG: efflux RND transporter periplasmic adaptor subunit [Bacteroidetes bacterium]|nr:efflux RND transporter periplasmic adaptor subunit [Bacteroidota bacterium]